MSFPAGVIQDPERLADRARALDGLGRNGLRLATLWLDSASPPAFALLTVEFHTAHGLAVLPPPEAFVVSGGQRVRGVRVTQVLPDPDGRAQALQLRLEPVGDYSSYELATTFAGVPAPGDALGRLMDPLFNRLPFKFRPGCFNLNCAPTWAPQAPTELPPALDTLARDYDSFRHLLMAAMAQRVPGWRATSEADLDQVLIDLIAATGDELADHHDRVIAERAITSARKRVSLARHGRLVDYHLHQGNQASTWLAATTAANSTDLPALATDPLGAGDEFVAWNGPDWRAAEAVVFALPHEGTRWRRRVFAALNRVLPYTWGGTVRALAAGSTGADLVLPGPASEADAITLEDLLNGASGLQATAPAEADVATAVDQLLIEEELNPATGTPNGRRVAQRQCLRLVPVGGPLPRAQRQQDPVTGAWFVRVNWLAEDALASAFCLVADNGTPEVSVLCGNLLRVTQGRPRETRFLPPGQTLPAADEQRLRALDHAHWLRHVRPVGTALVPSATLCALPTSGGALAYTATPADGLTPPKSTAQVFVSGFAAPWSERIDLIESRGDEEHFTVEVHENQTAQLRFGDNANGRALPDDASVTLRWRAGQGVAGNVGADSLVRSSSTALTRVWNPFDVVDGRAPETPDEFRRRAPEAWRRVQRRAVTLADYAHEAEQVPGVSHAAAAYAWCGSWRVVRVAIDPVGGGTLTDTLREQVATRLEALRLIGDDVELRGAVYVPLDIRLALCAHSGYWVEDLRAELEMAFSDADVPPQPWGRQGLFHPELWSFGQSLHASQLIGRALAVTGVERVLSLSMRRFNPGAGGGLAVVTVTPEQLAAASPATQRLDFGGFEIPLVANDPDHLERGRIQFDIRGGRR